MQFRPCIDIHNGAVRQIVGGSLKDEGDQAITNFTSEYDARFYANLYRKDGIRGGHIILLNPSTSEYFDATKKQALEALRAYPQGMQIGGGVTAENAKEYLDAGASHVIVTSYVFRDGEVKWENLQKLKQLNLLAQCLDHTVQVMFVLTDDLDRMAVVQTHHTENALCISNAALHVMHADLIVALGSGRHDSLYFCEVGNLDLSYHNNDLHK